MSNQTASKIILLSALDVALFDRAAEQHSIVIGQRGRRRSRGDVLAEERIRRDERVRLLQEQQHRDRAAQPQQAVVISARCGQTGIAIGDCGCNTCRGAAPMATTATMQNGRVSFSTAPPTNIPVYPGAQQQQGAQYAPTPGNSGPVGDPNDPYYPQGNDRDPWWLTGCRPTAGCYPISACDPRREFKTRTFWDIIRTETRCRRAPYDDLMADWVEMDYIVSLPTTLPPGVTTNILVQPTGGTFAVFYWDIVVVDPVTQVSQVDWRVDHPRVSDCPVPCAQPQGPMLAQFIQKVPEACCGNPLVAWLDRASENLPLTVPVTNNQAAGDLLGQVRVHGYCCSTRIC